MKSRLLARGGRWRYLVPIVAAGAALAACSSNTSTASPVTPAPVATGGASSNASVEVTTHSGPLGTYLTDGSGKTLYLFATDTGPTSMCTGTCAQNWPPLTTTGTPQPGNGVTGSDLTTTARSDGTMQVDYHGHPLYYFAKDSAAGDINGQGVNFQGLWWVVSQSGTAIQSKASAPSTAGSSTSGSGTGSSGTGWS